MNKIENLLFSVKACNHFEFMKHISFFYFDIKIMHNFLDAYLLSFNKNMNSFYSLHSLEFISVLKYLSMNYKINIANPLHPTLLNLKHSAIS